MDLALTLLVCYMNPTEVSNTMASKAHFLQDNALAKDFYRAQKPPSYSLAQHSFTRPCHEGTYNFCMGLETCGMRLCLTSCSAV
jgi:hypothetical protein